MGSYSKHSQVPGLIIGALLICAGAAAGEKQNYLATIGPTPIRFQAARTQYDPANVLPPLKMSDAPVTNVVEAIVKPEQEQAFSPTAEATAVAPEQTPQMPTLPQMPAHIPVGNIPTPTPPAATPESRTETGQMTPQMLLRYFNKDGTEVVVPAPIEFTPPSPAGAGGRSSAVYSSPPAK